ncbi:ceramidase [Chenggangzhangella methanolivorans]|uniref:Ceramidase n=1 Tax=Chenggangzhangella methanolivorans TaxID=1437009 RepID=A0A9E6UPR5_9HYPH|nr:ceramidase [Chenggangzhangella methanolivorans]QZO00065.1 ceramidase [Chenggangzhangella methanolivorans]
MSDGAGAKVLGVYCERGFDPTFWAEPVNAVTNAAFIMAGAVALVRWRGDRAVELLAATTLAIGVGSFLFHTFATRWALLADVIPIQAFIALYFFFAMRRFFGLGPLAAICATGLFMAAAATAPSLLPRDGLWRGLGGYVGGLLGLLGVGAALLARPAPGPSDGRALMAVAALFAMSLTFRTLDGVVCEAAPTGAHPLWHILNAAVLFTLMAILGRRPPRIRPNPPLQ